MKFQRCFPSWKRGTISYLLLSMFLGGIGVGQIVQWNNSQKRVSVHLPETSHRKHVMLLSECERLRADGATLHSETFELTNTSGRPCEIHLVSRSCACVDASVDDIEISQTGVYLQPGVPYQLRVSRPLPISVCVRKEDIVLGSDTLLHKAWSFHVSLEVLKDVELTPSSFNFESNSSVAEQHLTVRIRSRDPSLNSINVQAENLDSGIEFEVVEHDSRSTPDRLTETTTVLLVRRKPTSVVSSKKSSRVDVIIALTGQPFARRTIIVGAT